MSDPRLTRAELDEALNDLADMSVALISLGPFVRLMRPENTGALATEFLNDALDAAGRLRRQLDSVRLMLDDDGLHSVKA